MKNCNHDSTTIAYIVTNSEELVNDETPTINISEYLLDTALQEQIKNGDKLLVCKNSHILNKYKSEKIKSHFYHSGYFRHIDNTNVTNESQWHLEWKTHFLVTEHKLDKKNECYKTRIADAIIGHKTLEFQHSEYTIQEIDERSSDHQKHGYEINWIIDCTDDTISITKCGNSLDLISFNKNEWKYYNFKNLPFIFLDNGINIYKINPNHVVCDMIYVNQSKTKQQFIDDLNNGNDNWNELSLPQCKIYLNQFGAGCGKTYDSIQLLNLNDNEDCCNFIEKRNFIYLTKMHSAKEVIYTELMEQHENGMLSNFKKISNVQPMPVCLLDCDNNTFRNIETPSETKQYKISYTNLKNNKECQLVIGTIDSFMMKLGNTHHNDGDFFSGIIDSIKNGYIKKANIEYNPISIKLCKETLIIIDEAQDLEPNYIMAIAKIMGITHVDCYIIGDKLQSIWGENNTFTYLKNNDFLYPIEIIRRSGKNKVRRFHNPQFIPFVNRIINFEKHDLIPIDGICDDKNCKYMWNHNNPAEPYTIFTIPTVYSNEYKLSKINGIMKKITNYMDAEIENHSYLPYNFCFIFPYLNKNALANRLESQIEKYWKDKFNDPIYLANVVKSDTYWSKNYNPKRYTQFVYFHKSNEGKSINLKESRYATRILSIHASKGTGCEVVFLLGISEKCLHFYSNKTGSLQYDSLLHVAITRQKNKLYIGLVDSDVGSNMFNKFTGFNIEYDSECVLNLDNVKSSFDNSKISNYNFNHNFEKLDQIFEILDKKSVHQEQSNTAIIDFGHHMIRYAVFRYGFYRCIYNNETNDDNTDQFRVILRKIANKKVKPLNYDDYYKYLKEIEDANKKGEKDEKDIPVLFLDSNIDKNSGYYLYRETIIKMIEHIQPKLVKSQLPVLCPLESVILQHIIGICDNGIYSEVTAIDLYNIINCYDGTYQQLDHSAYNCKCLELLTKQPHNGYKDINNSIKNHYEELKIVEYLYKKCKYYLENDLKIQEKFKYNVDHLISLDTQCNKDLKIHKKFWLIAHSNSYVINYIVKPNFTKINYNDTIVDIIHDNYLINNSNGNNKKRYDNKKIINCILSLNNKEPIFYDINDQLNKYKSDLANLIKESLKYYLTEHHDLLFRYFNYLMDHRPKVCRNSIKYIYDQLVTLYYSGNKKDKHPGYILEFITDIKNNLNAQNVKSYKQMIQDESEFLKQIEVYLEKYIDKSIDSSHCDDIDF